MQFSSLFTSLCEDHGKWSVLEFSPFLFYYYVLSQLFLLGSSFVHHLSMHPYIIHGIFVSVTAVIMSAAWETYLTLLVFSHFQDSFLVSLTLICSNVCVSDVHETLIDIHTHAFIQQEQYASSTLLLSHSLASKKHLSYYNADWPDYLWSLTLILLLIKG